MSGQDGREGMYHPSSCGDDRETASYYAAYSAVGSPAVGGAAYQLAPSYLSAGPMRSRASSQPGGPPDVAGGVYHRDSGVYLGGPSSPGYASELDLSGRYRSYKDSSGDQGGVVVLKMILGA